MDPTDKKRICDLIKKSLNPLILIPENFDIDTVNGVVGLYLFLKKNKKNPKIACAAEIPDNFLPPGKNKLFEHSILGECLYKISFDLDESQVKELSYIQEGNTLKIDFATLGAWSDLEKPRVALAKFNYDLILAVGSSDLGSLGKIYYDNVCFFSEAPIVNIDCREENGNFGSINLVEADSSVSGIIAGIANEISRDAMDSEMANLFLTGIVARTKNLRSVKINAETFDLVSILIKTGANKEEIIKRLVSLKLLAEEKTEFYPSLKVTKQAVDSMNRSFPWYLRQEREKIERMERSKLMASKRIFYFAAALGAMPSLLFIGQGSFALAPVAKSDETAYIEKSAPVNNVSIPRNIELPAPAVIPKPEKVGIPKKITIPISGVDASIQEVGLTSGGEMATPNNFKNVGWFNLGARPGEIGSAVVAGHLDTYTDNGGIFWNLNKLKPGDYVYVTDDNGIKRRFRVSRSEVYRVDKAPMEEIFGSKGVARFNLITCNGAWDNGEKSYNKRLVVYTDYDPE